MSKYLLEMKEICKSFPGVKALDKANLNVREGTVHALMGENGAGKSTLMKCLFGVYVKDEGEIRIEGNEIQFKNPKQAMENGVAMVHQELNQVLQMNIMDNIWLGRYPMKSGVIDEKKMFAETKNILDELDINVNPKGKMNKLSVSERQMVEIAKAVSYDTKILVLDEPTSSLTEQEVSQLFKIIEKLKKKGCGIIYISHKMEEILQISDDVTIMRDGKWIATENAKDLTIDNIIKLMVGRNLENRFPPKDNVVGEVMLEIKNLSSLDGKSIKDVSFNLKKGEILGIAGLVGSGRTELLETIFGVRGTRSGEIYLNDNLISNKNPIRAIKNGFALITEERRANGIFGKLDIKFNSSISNLGNYSKYGLLDNKQMKEDTKWVIDSMKVKTPNQGTAIKTLSGGNQQKVIIGRWLLTNPDILLLDEPTRGIDVGAKYEIYQLIIDLAKNGKGVIVVSSEMVELIGICDRIMVMSNGYISGEGDARFMTQEDIMSLATKHI